MNPYKFSDSDFPVAQTTDIALVDPITDLPENTNLNEDRPQANIDKLQPSLSLIVIPTVIKYPLSKTNTVYQTSKKKRLCVCFDFKFLQNRIRGFKGKTKITKNFQTHKKKEITQPNPNCLL